MAVTSTMLPLGTSAPGFSLIDAVSGDTVSLSDYVNRDATLVMFICNHCPYVQHVREGLAQLGRDFENSSVGIVAISSNDVEAYPADSPEMMKKEADMFDYRFPYLFDETQEVAQAYTAMCTPDFFLFNRDHELVYRGRFDQTRPNMPGRVTGEDLRAAVRAVLAGTPVSEDQRPSMGCSIKWRRDNVPAYFG